MLGVFCGRRGEGDSLLLRGRVGGGGSRGRDGRRVRRGRSGAGRLWSLLGGRFAGLGLLAGCRGRGLLRPGGGEWVSLGV